MLSLSLSLSISSTSTSSSGRVRARLIDGGLLGVSSCCVFELELNSDGDPGRRTVVERLRGLVEFGGDEVVPPSAL